VGGPGVEERRIVTVLFADLVGFTALAERMDPEQVKRLVDGAFGRLVDDVVSFGGSVDKLLGDGIVALFGAPVAHEDDAERAVRAALRMHRTLDGLEVPLRMRIGINTGEVLVGTVASTDYTAMGDVVNLASRLQAAAEPGGVLVGESTFNLTVGSIEFGEMIETQARGRDQEVRAWPVVGTITAPGERVRRTDLPLIGRTAEMGLADAALTLSLGQRRSLLLNVVGESGVGKTRLVEEIIDAVLLHAGHGRGLAGDGHPADGATVLEGVCLPYGETNAWAPLATALADHLGVDPNGPVEELRAEAERKARALARRDRPTPSEPSPVTLVGDAAAADDVAADATATDDVAADATATDVLDDALVEDAIVERVVEVFVHLFGHASALDGLEPAARIDLVHRAVARVVGWRAEVAPLVLWLDDLHWADPQLIDLLEHLLSSFSRVPFVLVTSMRADSGLEWPPPASRASVVSLSIQPLARSESDELARELLADVGDGVVDQRVLGTLYDRSGGNPLFLQQLADVVADDPAAELPDSLRALIAARLDQLPSEERQILDNAAVLGSTGSIDGLERFAAAMRQGFDRAPLLRLEAKGLLEVDGQRWRFRSDSVRDAAYQTLTKSSRAQRHAGVAASYQRHAPTAYEDLAHHTASAAELVAELGPVPMVPATIRDDAVRYLDLAAERARETGANRRIVRHATRALDLIGDHPATTAERMRFLILRSSAAIELRDYVMAVGDLAAVLDDAVARGDVEQEGIARRQLGSVRMLEGDAVAARAEFGRSIELLREAGSTKALADALRNRGFMELFGGSLAEAEWFFGEAEAEYRALDDERGLAYIDQHRAWAGFLSGDLELADQRLHRAAATLDRLGDRNGVGWAFGLLAFVRFFQRRFDEAEDLASIVRSEAHERGDDWAAAMMQTLLADLRLWQGRLDEALANAEQARSRFRRIGDRFGLVQALAALVRTQIALGRSGPSQRTLEELAALSDSSPAGPVPLLAIAGAAMHRGDGQAAWTAAQEAIRVMTGQSAGAFEAHVLAAIAAVQCGDLDGALAAVDEIPDNARAHPFAMVAAALVASFGDDADEALRLAEAVTAADGASYLDVAIVAVVAAGAHVRLGDPEQAERVLHETIVASVRIGDRVTTALLRAAHERIVGEPHASGVSDPALIGPGWHRVVQSLPTAEVVA
jgi:class 3 adenylate cyclase/tetratricopeptide (TPR) repeat protein